MADTVTRNLRPRGWKRDKLANGEDICRSAEWKAGTVRGEPNFKKS